MERDPEEKRQRIVEAAVLRLTDDGVEAIRMLLTPSALARTSGVNRDSAYRVFADSEISAKDAVVLEAARVVHTLGIGGSDGGIEAAALRYTADVELPVAARLRATLRAILDANVGLPNTVAGWFLHGASIRAPRSSDGDPREDRGAGDAVASEIRRLRAAMYRQVDAALEPMLAIALDDHARRLEPGVSFASMLQVMHSLIDGAVLRFLIDPEAVDLDFVADALYRLAYVYSEPGAAQDPRRLTDRSGGQQFDLVVAAASSSSAAAQPVDPNSSPTFSVEEIATTCGVPLDDAHEIFPTVSDLADSVLRLAILSSGGPEPPVEGTDRLVDRAFTYTSDTARQLATSRVAGLLRRVADAADQYPSLLRLVEQDSPAVKPSTMNLVASALTESLTVLIPAPKAAREAHRMLAFATQGRTGRQAAAAVLATVVDISDGGGR